MRRSSLTAILTAACLALAAAAGFGYSGTLTWDAAETQLDAADGTSWASTSTSLYWQVDQVDGVWHYLYTFTVPAKNISHFILETSQGLVLGTDIYGYILPVRGSATRTCPPEESTASSSTAAALAPLAGPSSSRALAGQSGAISTPSAERRAVSSTRCSTRASRAGSSMPTASWTATARRWTTDWPFPTASFPSLRLSSVWHSACRCC